MQRCISVPFQFKGKEYYAIVRQYIIDHKTYYRIRIMNHRLDSLLHKANLNIIDELENMPASWEMKNERGELLLKSCIVKELAGQLSRHNEDKPFHFITDFGLLTPF